jgi:hypothetical protein
VRAAAWLHDRICFTVTRFIVVVRVAG